MPRPKPLEKGKERNLTIKMPDDLLARIDERRRHEPDIPSRTKMMRRLLVSELNRWEAAQKKRQGVYR